MPLSSSPSKEINSESELMNPIIPDNEENGLIEQQRPKTLSLFNAVTMSVGCIIGSGIFVTPGEIHKRTGGSVGLSLIVWLVSGLFTAIGAYCYTELGTLIRKSGGEYIYILQAFGPILGFIRLWVEAIIVRPCTVAVVALTFSQYALQMLYPGCIPPDSVRILTATLLISIVAAINCISVRVTTKLQDILTIAKIVALSLIISTGIYYFVTGDPPYRKSFENLLVITPPDYSQLSLAFYAGLFAYSGWNYLNYIVDELENPKRNLPLATAIAITTCTVIHLLVVLSFYTVLSPEEMSGSTAVGVAYATSVFGRFGFIMPIFVAMSTFGSANGIIYTSSRLFYSGAKEGQMPVILTMTNRQTQAPIPAVILMSFLSIMYLLLSSQIDFLIQVIQILFWIVSAGTILALIYFRRSMPTASRPIKVNLIFPLIFFIGCILLTVVPFFATPKVGGTGFAVMLTAIPVYTVFIAWENKPSRMKKICDQITVGLQKLFMVFNDDDRTN